MESIFLPPEQIICRIYAMRTTLDLDDHLMQTLPLTDIAIATAAARAGHAVWSFDGDFVRSGDDLADRVGGKWGEFRTPETY